MLILIFSGLAVVCFILGGFFLFGGLKSSPEEGESPSLGGSKDEGLPAGQKETPSLTRHLLDENLKQEGNQKLEEQRLRTTALKKEIILLTEALEHMSREIQEKFAHFDEENEQFRGQMNLLQRVEPLLDTLVNRLAGRQEELSRLTQNLEQRLKQNQADLAGKEKELVQIQTEQKNFEQKKAVFGRKIQELENEITGLRQQLRASRDETGGITEKWQKEKEELAGEMNVKGQKCLELQEQLDAIQKDSKVSEQLREEIAALENEREGLTQAKADLEKRIEETSGLAQTLKKNEEEIRRKAEEEKTDIQKQLREISASKAAAEQQSSLLHREKTDLETRLKKAEQSISDFKQKEKILQEELLKARTQSLGLEKMCEDFKILIEQGEEKHVKR